jgi:hypothetical protein
MIYASYNIPTLRKGLKDLFLTKDEPRKVRREFFNWFLFSSTFIASICDKANQQSFQKRGEPVASL